MQVEMESQRKLKGQFSNTTVQSSEACKRPIKKIENLKQKSGLWVKLNATQKYFSLERLVSSRC